MTQNKHCPRCHSELSPKIRKCRCGWMQLLPAKQIHTHSRCEYALEGRYCPLPGTICSRPYASGPWYCIGHWRALDDEFKSREIFNAAMSQPSMSDVERDWRDVMVDSVLSQHQKTHPKNITDEIKKHIFIKKIIKDKSHEKNTSFKNQ